MVCVVVYCFFALVIFSVVHASLQSCALLLVYQLYFLGASTVQYLWEYHMCQGSEFVFVHGPRTPCALDSGHIGNEPSECRTCGDFNFLAVVGIMGW